MKYGLPAVLELLEIDHSHHIKEDENKEKYLDINDKNLTMLVKYLSSVEDRTNGIIELYNLFQNRQMGEPLVKIKNKKITENIQVSLNNIHDITSLINQKDEFCRKEELITVSMANFKQAALEEITKKKKEKPLGAIGKGK